MAVKIIIQNTLFVAVTLLMLICYMPSARAQVNDTLSFRIIDSASLIKQLLKVRLEQQLKQYGGYQVTEKNKIKQLLNDSTAIDSLGKLVLQQIGQLKNGAIHTGKSMAAGMLQTPQQIIQEQLMKCMQVIDIKGLISRFTGIIKQPLLQWNTGAITINGQNAPAMFADENTVINNSIISGSWSLMGMPIGAQLVRQDFSGLASRSRTTFSFQFDREAYLSSLRGRINIKIKASDIVPGYSDLLQQIKLTAMNRLKLSLDSINAVYKGKLSGQLEKLGSAENLLNNDLATLKSKLLSADFLQNIEQNKNRLAELQQQMNAGKTIDIGIYDSLLQIVQSAAGNNNIISILNAFKNDIQNSGLLKKLQQADLIKNNQLQQYLNDPDKLKAMAKTQLGLSGMKKFFLNINELKTGLNTVSLSPLTMYQYANNGFNAAFVNKKTYLFIMAGKQKDGSSLLDSRFRTPLITTGYTSMGIRAGQGDITQSYTHVSMFSYKQNNSNNNGADENMAPSSTVVATVSKAFKFSETNALSVELSKSAHKYNNDHLLYDTLRQSGILSKQLLNGSNASQQMAFSFEWNGSADEKQLAYTLHGRITGKGYNNPGNIFLSRGETAFGGSFRKNLLQHQLQLSAKMNYRELQYGDNNTKWRSYNFSVQGKWKFKKGQYVSLSYQPYQTQHTANDINYTAGTGSRLTAEGNFRKRFGLINYQHTVSMASLNNNYLFGNAPVSNNSVLISSMQTIGIGNRNYYVSTQYNRAFTSSILWLFNTQLNVETGLMYSLLKGIMGSTAIHYCSTKEWYQQLGIKQSISGQVGKRFLVTAYADLLNNIKEYRPGVINNTRLAWSLQYLLQ